MEYLEFFVFVLLFALIGVLFYISIKYINKYNKLSNSLETIYDNAPSIDTPQARAMQLSNELEKYICTDDKKEHIYITVLNPNK